MTGDAVRQGLAAMLPQGEIDCLCAPCGVTERQRKLQLGLFVRAMVLSAGPPGGAYQADVLRSSLACEVPPVARSAFDRWFEAPLDRCLAALADRALAYARAQQVDLAGPLCGVTAWSIVEATTVTGRAALREECPGTGGYAAMQVHTILSVGGGAPVPSHCSPARAHDSRHRQREASWRGYGLLADLASASGDRLRACDPHGVRYVIRRQEHGQPNVDHSARGQVTPAFLPGTDFEALVADQTLVLDGRTIDADVPGGRGRPTLARRRVGVQTPQGAGLFLTTLPPRLGPRQGADLYRVRWEVALRSRLDTSVHRLDAIDADQPWTLNTLLPASLIASTSAALLAHTHHGQTRPQQEGAPRTQAPWHPRRLALPRAVSGQSMAQAFELTGTEATRRGDKIAERLPHAGKDPHGRRRPSVLDQLRGGKRQPLARKQANSQDISRRNIKEAA